MCHRRAAQHNGKEGRVIGYDLSSARYTVQLEAPDTAQLAVKHDNCLQKLAAEVVGLHERQALNGCAGLIGACTRAKLTLPRIARPTSLTMRGPFSIKFTRIVAQSASTVPRLAIT